MSLKHAILGFLSVKPLSGYDLKKAFDKSVRHFWTANQSQIYRTLADLDNEGLVAKDVIAREDRLDMKVYHLTDAGEAELRRWLSTPLPQSDLREPFLIQVYFSGILPDEAVLGLLRREIGNAQALLQVYRAVYDQNAARMPEAQDRRGLFLSLLTLEYGILANAALLRWLESAKARLETGDYTMAPFEQMSGD